MSSCDAFVPNVPVSPQVRTVAGCVSLRRPMLQSVRLLTRAHVTFAPRMGLRAVESYNGAFDLSSDVRDALVSKLMSEEFAKKVAKQAMCESVSFTGDLFQPVPYSLNTPRGMPSDMEVYASDPNFMIINIPPVTMFEARCFKPSRLCAVFRKFGVPEDVLQDLRDEEQRLQEMASSKAARPAQDDEWAGLGGAIRDVFEEKPLTPEEEEELDNLVV